jgi:protein-disulfide isomerase
LLCILTCSPTSAAQDAPTTKSAAPAAGAKTTPAKKPIAAPQTVKREAPPAPASRGITRDQADAILNELKAIHQLLVAQGPLRIATPPSLAPAPTPAAPSVPTPPAVPTNPIALNDQVHMKLESGWHWMGRDDAPVTIVEFTDYQCPFCRKYHTGTFAQLKKNYIDTGKVRFGSRDLPLGFHANAQKAAEAAWCAGEQNKYWELRDTMITSADLSPGAIVKYAQANGLDLALFNTCENADKYKDQIQKDMAAATTVGISATPSFVIGKTAADAIDGDRVVGALPESTFEAEIQKFMTK